MKVFGSTVCLLGFCLFGSAIAQEPQLAAPQMQHQWLKKFVGQWTSVARSPATESSPAAEHHGSMKSRMFGQFWVVNELAGDAGTFEFKAIQTIGYDTVKKKYVGTWIDTMTGFQWKYEGFVTDDGTKIVLEAEGPNVIDPSKGDAKYRDSYEFTSSDTAVATSEILDEKGQWITMMKGEMTRVKD